MIQTKVASAQSARAEGAGGVENRRRARRSPSSGASAGHLPRSRRFPYNICLRVETASPVQLRALLLSASVAPWSASRARVEIEVIVSFASCSLAWREAPPTVRTTPEPAHRHILGDGTESLPLDPPCREVVLHSRRQQHEDGRPAQRCGAFLHHCLACGACKRADRCGACHQRWPAASRGWKSRAASDSGRDGAAVPIARPIKVVEESPPATADPPGGGIAAVWPCDCSAMRVAAFANGARRRDPQTACQAALERIA